jgi:ribosomal protein S3
MNEYAKEIVRMMKYVADDILEEVLESDGDLAYSEIDHKYGLIDGISVALTAVEVLLDKRSEELEDCYDTLDEIEDALIAADDREDDEDYDDDEFDEDVFEYDEDDFDMCAGCPDRDECTLR